LGKYRPIQTYEQRRKRENELRGYTLGNSKSTQKKSSTQEQAASSIFTAKITEIWEEKSEDPQGPDNHEEKWHVTVKRQRKTTVQSLKG
jgi:hypothetical protein